MQGLMLAAGMGKRLAEYTNNNTKCMLKIKKMEFKNLLSAQNRDELRQICCVWNGSSAHCGMAYPQAVERRWCRITIPNERKNGHL